MEILTILELRSAMDSARGKFINTLPHIKPGNTQPAKN